MAMGSTTKVQFIPVHWFREVQKALVLDALLFRLQEKELFRDTFPVEGFLQKRPSDAAAVALPPRVGPMGAPQSVASLGRVVVLTAR